MLLLQVGREIKDYIKQNPGCRFIDVVRGTKKSARIVHKCIEDLIKKEEIAKREVRSRVFRYYINKNQSGV